MFLMLSWVYDCDADDVVVVGVVVDPVLSVDVLVGVGVVVAVGVVDVDVCCCCSCCC